MKVPISNPVEHLLHAFSCHSSVFFGEVFIQTFCSFFSWVIYLLIVNFECSLYIQDTRPSADTCFAKMFSQFATCLFIFLRVSFELQKFLMLIKKSYSSVFFFLWIVIFVSHKEKPCLSQSHKDFLPEILSFTCRPIIHFHLISVYDAKYRLKAFACFCM